MSDHVPHADRRFQATWLSLCRVRRAGLLLWVFAGMACQSSGWSGGERGTETESPRRTTTRPIDEPAPPAAARRDGPPPPAGSVVPAVLMVNGEPITVEDVLEPIRPMLQRVAASATRDEYHSRLATVIRRQISDEVVERLIWQQAKREVDEQLDERIEKAVDRLEQDRIEADFAGREARYEEHLASMRLTRDEARLKIKRRLVVQQYLRDRLLPQVSLRKPDLWKFYTAHPEEFTTPRRAEVFMIDVPVRAFAVRPGPVGAADRQAAVRRARSEIERCRERLRSGEPFEAVAKDASVGSKQDEGGSWGMLSAPLRGRWEKPSQAALSLAAGQTSEIIETADGFFIVKCGRVEGGERRSFEQAQADIAEKLRAEQFESLRRSFLERMWKEASIENVDGFVRLVVARAPESATISNERAGDRPG